MGCGPSRDRAVSVKQGASVDELLPVGLAGAAPQPPAAQPAAPPAALVFAGPTAADRCHFAVPPSPCLSERSLDMFVVGEDMPTTDTPTLVRKSKALSYSPTVDEHAVEQREPVVRLQQSDGDRMEVSEQLQRGQQLLWEAQASLAAAGHRQLVQQPLSPSAERFVSRLASRYPDSSSAGAATKASPWKERTTRGPALVSPTAVNSRRERVAPTGFRIARAEPEPEPHLESAAATRPAAARRVQFEVPNFDDEMDTLSQLEAMLHVGSSTLQPPTRFHHEEAQEFRSVLATEPTSRVGMLRGAEEELDALMRREMELLDEGKELLAGAELDMARAMVEAVDEDDATEVDAATYSFEPSNNRREPRQRVVSGSKVVRDLPDASRPNKALAPIGQLDTAGSVALPRVARSRRALAPLSQNTAAPSGGNLGGMQERSSKATAGQTKALGRRAGVQQQENRMLVPPPGM